MLRCAFLFCLLIAFGASAEEAKDLDTRTVRYAIDYRINGDATFVEQREQAIKILTERAINRSKQTSVTYSTSIQIGEVVHAYTLKADGRRVEVPSNNYQFEINQGKGKDSPVYSDQTTLTVVFPDVAVGDTLVWAYRLTAREPLFPGHFSEIESFSPYMAYDDVRITVDAPASMWTQHKAYLLKESGNIEKDGRRILTWQWSNPNPEKRKPSDYGGIYEPEKTPGLYYTTFRSYAEIADAYGSRARKIAEVTPRVQKLADEIAANAKGQREIAHALYNWVARNISYAGNCIGLGAVVPRDLDFVLNNRMGDCKDHATLYQALLSAKGIKSVQALVNSGSSYSLPEVPVVAMVNHVINYLPELDMYADSTSDSTPFGMLPFGDADKPVLWTDGYRDNTRTPVQPAAANSQYLKTDIQIAADGSAKVEMKVALKGMFGVSARDRYRGVPKSRDEDMVKGMLQSMNLEGSGTFSRGDAEALVDTFDYAVSFQAKEMYKTGAASAFAISPMFYTEAPIYSMMSAVYLEENGRSFPCAGGQSIEEYTIHLPKNTKLLAVPENVAVETPSLRYSSSYKRKGNVLSVKRMIVDRVPGHVCTPAMLAEFKKAGKKIMNDLKAQVIYQLP